jgi:hypothetical protein
MTDFSHAGAEHDTVDKRARELAGDTWIEQDLWNASTQAQRGRQQGIYAAASYEMDWAHVFGAIVKHTELTLTQAMLYYLVYITNKTMSHVESIDKSAYTALSHTAAMHLHHHGFNDIPSCDQIIDHYRQLDLLPKEPWQE